MDIPQLNDSSILIIVSGPAGSGKTTVCDRMLEAIPSLGRAITSTTRAPRGQEQDTIDYYFFDRTTFEAKIEAGDFYEYAHVHSNLYGTLKSEVQGKLNAGTDLLLNIDVQGAAQMRANALKEPLLQGRVITVFIMPPSVAELENRLRGRGTDADDEVQRRMQVALDEMQQAKDYDYVLLSASRDEDFDSLRSIYRAEKMRVRE